jgi:hypothetical protein
MSQQRFIGPDGREYVSIVVGRSRPFAAAVIRAWGRVDGADHWPVLAYKAFSVPAEIFDGPIVSQARAEVEASEAADGRTERSDG